MLYFVFYLCTWSTLDSLLHIVYMYVYEGTFKYYYLTWTRAHMLFLV